MRSETALGPGSTLRPGKLDADFKSTEALGAPKAYPTAVDSDDLPHDGESEPVAWDRLVQPVPARFQILGEMRLDTGPIILDKDREATRTTQAQTNLPSRPLGSIVQQISKQLQHVLLVEGNLLRGVDLRGYRQGPVLVEGSDAGDQVRNVRAGSKPSTRMTFPGQAGASELAIDQPPHPDGLLRHGILHVSRVVEKNRVERRLQGMREIA